MVDAAKLARAGYTYLGRLYSEMDCQEFVEQCLRDCGLKIDLPGSNAWYRKMTWVGSPEECKKLYGHIPVGAFLFILDHDGKEPDKYKRDGIGNASHIGIYTGRGTGAIHSSASKGCVVESRFSGKTINGGWNRVGLWNRIGYDVKISGDSKIMGYDAIVSASSVNLREKRSRRSGLIAQIPNGTLLHIMDDDGTWAETSYMGFTGYVMTEYITKTTDASQGKSEAITVDRNQLETVYNILGNMLGRG